MGKPAIQRIVRFRFEPPSPFDAIEEDLLLALFCAECLYGSPRLQLEAGYLIHPAGTSAVLEIQGAAGEAAERIFLGLISSRLGDDAVSVEHVDRPTSAAPQAGSRR